MSGVINTISGSIPATGFADSPLATVTAKNDRRASVPSIQSDLNVIMNNSCTSLHKLNGIHRQEQQLSQIQQCDFTIPIREAYVPYHRTQPCSALERNTNVRETMAHGSGLLSWDPAIISVAIVIAALAGPQWLFTEEKLPNVNYNGTANFNAMDDGAFITKYTKSSLWILCTTIQEYPSKRLSFQIVLCKRTAAYYTSKKDSFKQTGGEWHTIHLSSIG
ncbi:hypothetical protein GQX74_008423 [Glossina fuscipes]|nr:hypothetical protein GQX74_008423 [Glossina fuscipes]